MATGKWSVDYYKQVNGRCPVEEWLDSVPLDARADIFRIFDLMEEHGLNVGMPYIRPIEGKIYEVRAKEKDGIYRVLYFAHTGKRFVMLHGFMKKTQKTPRKEIEIAKERMKEARQ